MLKPLIVIPAYTAINHRLMSVILHTGLPLLPFFEMSDLPRTRSLLLTAACKQECERVITIDSDIVPSADQLMELATSDHVTPNQALTGFYALRGGDGRMSLHAPEATEDTQVFPAEWGGLGFAAIHKESLVRLVNALPAITGDDREWTPFCVPVITQEGQYLSDDRSLWWRLKNAGVSLVASRSLHVGHIDSIVRY